VVRTCHFLRFSRLKKNPKGVLTSIGADSTDEDEARERLKQLDARQFQIRAVVPLLNTALETV
jgi:hypothetical protein